MVGNVVVDEPETEDPPPRIPAGWFMGLGAAVLLVLILLPGRPDTAVPPTSLTLPEVEVAEERWRPLDLPGGGTLTDVVALADDSYIAVGEGPQVWRYDPEGAWEWVLEAPPLPGTMTGVASYQDGAVAVGHDAVDGSVKEAAIWRTERGRDWRRTTLDVGRPTGLDGVFVAETQMVAWGWQGSARDFAPEAEPLLLRSDDGETWTVVDAFSRTDRSARLFTVTRHEDTWYAGGYATGRPALWASNDDMETWDRIDTSDLPFGWAVFDLSIEEDSRTAVLMNLSQGRARRWLHRDGAWIPLDERPGDPVLPVADNEQAVGVGNGSLWIDEDGRWEALELSGQVTAASGRVAVGVGPEMQPRVWMQDGDWAAGIQVPEADGGRWEEIGALSLGDFQGAWRVGDGWVIGGDPDRWWYLGRDRMESFAPPWEHSVSAIVPAGEEWVALPSMHWTSDGTSWEERAQPWAREGVGSTVEAVTESEGRLLAVGRDSEYLWNVAASTDGGRSWTPVDRPMVSTPLWTVAGTPEGFVATAARSRGTQEVVVSANGRTWETVARGSLLSGAQPPAALTDQGTLLMFDSGEELRPPRTDITSLVRNGDGLVLVAGGRLWVGDGEWEEIPLDPPHGMEAGRVHPLSMGNRVLAVGMDRGRGRLLIYEWQP